MPADIQNVHDKFFKSLIADKGIAVDWLNTFLPAEAREKLDLSTLEGSNETFVGPELKEYLSDVVFRCKLKDQEKQAWVSILLEHKSYKDDYAAVQILTYLANGYLDQWRKQKKLEPIIPVLFYHGSETWEYRDISNLLKDHPTELLNFVPEFEIVFIDLFSKSDAELLNVGNVFLRAALLLQKYSRHSDEILDKIQHIFSAVDPGGNRNLWPDLVVYFLKIVDKSSDKFFDKLNLIMEPAKSEIMSIYDQAIEKGMEKGIEKGMGKGMDEANIKAILNGFQSGLEVNLLSVITGWTEDKVRQVICEHFPGAKI